MCHSKDVECQGLRDRAKRLTSDVGWNRCASVARGDGGPRVTVVIFATQVEERDSRIRSLEARVERDHACFVTEQGWAFDTLVCDPLKVGVSMHRGWTTLRSTPCASQLSDLSLLVGASPGPAPKEAFRVLHFADKMRGMEHVSADEVRLPRIVRARAEMRPYVFSNPLGSIDHAQASSAGSSSSTPPSDLSPDATPLSDLATLRSRLESAERGAVAHRAQLAEWERYGRPPPSAVHRTHPFQ